MPMYAIDYFKVNIQRALSEKLKLVTGIASALVVATSVIFKLFHLEGAYTLLLIGAIIFTFGFLPFLFFNMYKKSISWHSSHGEEFGLRFIVWRVCEFIYILFFLRSFCLDTKRTKKIKTEICCPAHANAPPRISVSPTRIIRTNASPNLVWID